MIARIASIPFYYFSEIFKLIKSPELLKLCLTPYIIGACSFCAYIYAGYAYKEELSSMLLGERLEAYRGIFSWVIFAASLILSGLLSFITTLLFAAYYIEKLLEKALTLYKLTPYQSDNLAAFIRTLLRALVESTIRLLALLIIWVLTLLLGIFAPAAFLIILLAAFLVGYDLADQPLSLLGLNLKQRAAIILSHKAEVLALGGIYSILLIIPFAAIIFLPAALLSAVRLISQWRELKPIA